MLVAQGRVLYSASDLAAAARCEYALLRAFDAQLGWGPAVSADDELLARTAKLGAEHESRQLEDLRARAGGGPGAQAIIIGRPAYTIAGLTAAADATMRAVESRAPVIAQAAMFDGRFAGFADFLVLDGSRYRLQDTKLARSVKVEALLQLAAYTDALTAAGVPVHDEVELILGNGLSAVYRADELLPVYRARRMALQRLLDGHFAAERPADWDDDGVRACLSCPECAVELKARDDLLLVANLRVGQRAHLNDAGVTTMTELAGLDADCTAGQVPGIPARALSSLTAQARLQLSPREDGRPPYEVIDPQPLRQLPDPDRGDLFFDFEGDPLWSDDGRDWGLEYLFGVLTLDRSDEFRPLWAHDRGQERRALLDFLAMVRKRRRRYPNMHIYHYAPYERSALLRLAGRYGVGEDDVDDLLRKGVLVDLYPLVRKSIRVGTANYSLKSLEPLYMGSELRTGDVTTATDSITSYGRYCDLRADNRQVEAAVLLREIEDYNRYDCLSTRRLRDWLLARAFEAGVPPIGPQPVSGPGDSEADIEADDDLARQLAAFAGDDLETRTDQQQAVAMLAAARGYHRREDKPYWWGHYDRLNAPVDEWAHSAGVFVVDSAEIEDDWNVPPRARKPQRRLRLRGSIASGEPKPGEAYALYEPPAPAGLADDPERRGCGSATVLECDDDGTEIVLLEREPKHGSVFAQIPFAVTPGPPVGTRPLRESIESVAAGIGAGLPDLPETAIIDVLLRRAPRTRSGEALPRTGDTVADLTSVLLELDSSYVAVHGPPGTGKTHTAARVIAALINHHHWRIGVVAQSHSVVENLFRDAIAAGVDPQRVGKKAVAARGAATGLWHQLGTEGFASFISDNHGCLIGGTAWDFANANRIERGSLDLLAIEEAGQFSLANTIAVAPAARNLLLLGDPQQLPQVSQGTHPEPVDASALGWLVEGGHTLPPERGYFLDRSHRMHPAVCAAVSRLSYDGRLRSVEEVTAVRHLDGVRPGVTVRLVDHDGNSVDSPEEADVIVADIAAMLGTAWTDENGTRPLRADDVLVVTPYNAQVALLRSRLDAAGLHGVKAGTVDKFQGRQAPVVFISMVASSIADVPRGMAFLLNRNRLNVAVSRAKFAAVVVRSATLTDYLPSSPAGMVDLGAFLALCEGMSREDMGHES